MQSESRWLKSNSDANTYWNPKLEELGYREDKTTEKEHSPLKTIAIAGAIAAGGYGAYRSGALKNAIKQTIKYTGNYKAITPTATGAFRKWLQGGEDVNKASLLRSDSIGDLFKKLSSEEFKDQEVLKRTMEDFKNLKDSVKTNVNKKLEQQAADNLKKYADTGLSNDISTIESVANRYKDPIQRSKAKDIMARDVVSEATQSAERARQQIKRTGYRDATLDDYIKVGQDSKGNHMIYSSNDKAPMDEGTVDKLQKFLTETKAYDDKGNVLLDSQGNTMNLLNSGKYKNLVLDRNIMVDEAGNIADLRNATKTGDAFVRSLANDFKIPFVGINPLKFFGLGSKGISKQRFTTLSMESVQPIITGQTGSVKMKDVIEEFGSSEVLVSNGKGFKFNEKTNNFEMFRDDLELHSVSKNEYGISKQLNDLRKQANIKTRDYSEYTEEDGMVKNFFGKVGKKLDIGFQDSTAREFDEGTYNNILNALDPSTYIEKGFKKIFDRKIFNKGHGNVKDIGAVYGTHSSKETADEVMYVAMKKKIKFRETLDPNNNETIRNYFEQYLAGRDNLKDVNSGSLTMYNLFERMNQALNPFGLALSSESTGSVGDVLKNMLLKRFLPVYAGAQAIQYVNYLSEDDDGETIQQKGGKALAGTDIALHKVKDTVGLTDLFKKLDVLTPGNDHLGELPVIKHLGLARDTEETIDYYKEGMDPIRKGRYWNLGNTPFTGSKIQYWKPNWYRELMADADFSEVKYGSREEYFKNAWFPTISNPLSPVRHFITDKYHYEKKHYYDRPYLLSSPEFEGVPIFGHTLSATVGKIVKPQVKMHEEYWNKSSQENTSNNYNAYTVRPGTNVEDNQVVNLSAGAMFNMSVDKNVETGNISTIKPIYSEQELNILGAIPKIEDGVKEVYTTNSGQQSIVDINVNDIDKVKNDLGEVSIKRIVGVNERASSVENDRGEDPITAINPNSFKATLSNQYKDTTNVLGIYGFLTNAFVLGDLKPKEQYIETSGYAYSFNDKFWEQELGGLGGDLSEIFRRFVQPKRKDVEYYNPIKNTMPDWLPGEEYFTDFKHGDPYQKVAKGEIRLPGTPYEKLWGIENPLSMTVDAKSLSNGRESIINNIIKNDIDIDEESIESKTKTEQAKTRVLKEWSNNDYAVEGGAEINDTANNIANSYDAVIMDMSADNHRALANIVSVTNEEFEDVKNGNIDESLVSSLNHAMWVKEMDKGYIHFVNRDNNERYTKSFDYDEERLSSELEELNESRSIVNEKIENRELSRADLYSPIDRYRMLADIAPYSQQFKQLDSILSRSGMDDETKEEYDKINDRVKEQKKANRTYEYRFKTSNVEDVKTTITRVDGANVYVDFNGEERKVTLAGITAGVDGSADEKKAIAEVKKNLVEGAKVKLQIDGDELARDKTKGIKAVVIDSEGNNINKRLLNKGLAREKEDDWSAPSVQARFSKSQIAFGSIWETIAHSNTYLNTKFLQVRSAAEDYERREVYGKNFQSWNNPVEDYLKPSIYSSINRPGGILVGAFVGSLFGSSRGGGFGKVVGAVIGASTVAIGKAYKAGYEANTGEKWVPKVRREERDLNEYVDALKFVKNRKLYEKYKEKSLNEDGFDVEAYLNQKEEDANNRKNTIKELQSEKELAKSKYEQKKKDRDDFKENAKPLRGSKNYKEERAKYLEELEMKKSDTKISKNELQSINGKINEDSTFREIEVLPENATKAIEYRQNAEETMYGYDPGEPLTNILSALPKKDRDRFKYFLKAPEEERDRILEIVPSYLKRPLQSAWGMKAEKKPSLEKYFTNHQLPGEEWSGWEEDVDLDSVKVKMINTEGLSNSEFNVWEDDVNKANSMGAIPLPSINFRSNANEIRKRLVGLVGDYGIQDANVSFTYKGSGMDIDLDIEHDTRDKTEQKIRTAKFI